MNLKNRSLTALFLCTFMASLTPLSSAQIKASETPTLTKTFTGEGFQFTTQIEKFKFAPSTEISLTVKLKNITKDVLTHVESRPDYDYSIEVKNAQGEIMPLTRYGKGIHDVKTYFGIGSVEVWPDEEVGAKFIVNRIFDMTQEGGYTITVTHGVPKRDKTGLGKLISTVHLLVAGHYDMKAR